MSRGLLALVALTAAFVATVSDAGAALRFGECKGIDGASCATLRVPLDRSGALPGSLSLRVARAGSAKRGNKVLFALAGGPGQPGAFFAPFSRNDLGRAVEGYTVYGLDQRGTGASGVIKCSRLQA